VFIAYSSWWLCDTQTAAVRTCAVTCTARIDDLLHLSLLLHRRRAREAALEGGSKDQSVVPSMVGGYSATGMQRAISNTFESTNSKLDSNKSHASFNTQGKEVPPSLHAIHLRAPNMTLASAESEGLYTHIPDGCCGRCC
jgi:hypothetical protein